jgi:uncharacterized protein YhaN
MRIISCNITGFGKLVNFRKEFNRDFNSECLENESGKTTFAAFIKAMFYGMKAERDKYRPWSQARFGGQIEYEDDGGIHHRLEREFKNNNKADKIKLIKLPTHEEEDVSASVGEELFGVDESSFERTLILSGAPYIGTKNDREKDKIVGRLSMVLGNVDDAQKLDKAQKVLDSQRVVLLYKNSNGGKIFDLQNEKDECERKIRNLELNQQQMPGIERNIKSNVEETEKKEKERDALTKELENATKSAEKAKNRETYNKAKTEYESTQKELEQAERLFKKNPPTDDEIGEMRKLTARIAGNIEDEKRNEFSADKSDRLRTLEQRIISDELISELKDRRDNAKVLKMSYEKDESDTEFLSLKEMFEGKSADERRSTNKFPIIAAAVGILTALIAVVMLLLKLVPIAVVCFAVAAVCAVLAVMLYKKAKTNNANADAAYKDYLKKLDKINETKSEVGEIEKKNADLLAEKGWNSIEEAENAADEYSRLADEKKNAEEEAKRIGTEREELVRSLESMLEVCPNVGGTYDERVRTVEKYKRNLETSKLNAENAEKNFESAKRFAPDDSENTETFETPDEIKIKLADCNNEIRRLTVQKPILQRQKEDLEKDREKIIELKEQFELLDYNIKDSSMRLEAIQKAAELLDAADKELKNAYLPIMQESFKKYYGEFAQNSERDFAIDSKLNVHVNDNGRTGEISEYSSGRRDIVELCVRLSLIDAFFDGKQTFVLLDDPFVNLDDVNVKLAVKTLKKMTENRQIIYLTCSKSRMPE